jgi:hypothetical protein
MHSADDGTYIYDRTNIVWVSPDGTVTWVPMTKLYIPCERSNNDVFDCSIT